MNMYLAYLEAHCTKSGLLSRARQLRNTTEVLVLAKKPVPALPQETQPDSRCLTFKPSPPSLKPAPFAGPAGFSSSLSQPLNDASQSTMTTGPMHPSVDFV